MIHEGYKPELLDRSYNDIALIKFDRPFFPEEDEEDEESVEETVEDEEYEEYEEYEKDAVTQVKMMPICLPPSSAFKDEDKQGGSVMGRSIIDQARFCSGFWNGETTSLQD